MALTARRRIAWLVALIAALGVLAAPHPVRAEVPSPTVTGPIGDAGLRGHALWDSWFDLSELGYTEDEFFVSGTATDASGATAEYTTRIIVTRPADRKRFNGSVLMEWVNVTAQFENAVDIVEAHEYLLREGWAYVHVSAQAAGICCSPLTPKVWDPVRYAPLSHPGDGFANDIFSQVAKALRDPTGVDPLGGLRLKRLIAAGQSQSASRLYSYVTTEQPSAGLVDAFLIHGGGSKEYAQPPAAPVMHLLSDAEASPADPNQSRNYRLWEVAGSAHSDFWIGYHQVMGQGPRFAGAGKQPAAADTDLHAVAGNYGEQPHPMHGSCILAGAAFPTRYAVSAALDHLQRWAVTDKAPPAAPRYAFDASGQLARDEHGNALGGIRLPPVDVPVARYVSTACRLGGITVPLTDVELHHLYPTHDDYYRRMRSHAGASVKAGFLLEEDAADLLTRACATRSRWPGAGGAHCPGQDEVSGG